MASWTATCVVCGDPALGADRLAAAVCSRACYDASVSELQELDARLDMTRFAADTPGRTLHVIDGLAQFQRRSRLTHAIAGWERLGDRVPVAAGRRVRDPHPLSARIGR